MSRRLPVNTSQTGTIPYANDSVPRFSVLYNRLRSHIRTIRFSAPGKVGGTESYIRNLLDGLKKLDEDFDFTLLVSLDNADTFREYEKDRRFHLLRVKIESAGIAKRILWQNL